jgi:hypothetical protein
MSDEEVERTAISARSKLDEEHLRYSKRSSSVDPALMETSRPQQQKTLEEGDITALRSKFDFLKDFSDSFIRNTPAGELVKIETASIKINDSERARDAEDRLSANKMKLLSSTQEISAARDNRWSILHPARFLPGAGCSATRLWLAAREAVGHSGHPPLGCYDMSSVGLGGYVTSRGWCEIANPASSRISLKLFNINGCGSRTLPGSSKHTEDYPEIEDLGELKLALRALRVAMAFVHPWNMSINAIEGFMLATNFCQADTGAAVNRPKTLSQFVDYLLGENANRYRDSEAFLTTGDIKAYWESFFGARPQAASRQQVQQPPSQQRQQQQQQQTFRPQQAKNFTKRYPFVDVCHAWNLGKCGKPAHDCRSKLGTPLRHVCDHRPDIYRVEVCGLPHTRPQNH